MYHFEDDRHELLGEQSVLGFNADKRIMLLREVLRLLVGLAKLALAVSQDVA